MNNYFSKKLYFQGLKKIKVSGVALSIVTILLNAFLPIIGIAENSYYSSNRVPDLVENNMIVPFCLAFVFLVPIVAYDMFSFLNSRNQSDFYHSIPNKRTCVYVSFSAAVLTWAIGTVVLSAAVNSMLWSFARYYVLSFTSVILGVLPYIVLSVMMAGVTILAMTLTGTGISNVLVTSLFLLFFRVMSALCTLWLSEGFPIICIDYSAARFFNIEFFLPFALLDAVFDGSSSVYTDAPLLIYSFCVGLIAFVLGGLGYHYRKSESAASSAPNKWFQHVYRFAITLPFVFLVALFVYMDGFEAYHIILILLALLVYVLYELITTKKLKNVLKSLPLMIIPVAVTLVLATTITSIGYAIESEEIKAEDIEGFQYAERYYNTYEHIKCAEIMVNNSEAAEILERAIDTTIEGNYEGRAIHRQIIIKLKGGRTIARNLRIPYEDSIRLDNLRLNSPEYSAEYLKLPTSDEIKSIYFYNSVNNFELGDQYELYDSFYREYNSLSDEDKQRVKDPLNDLTYVTTFSVSGYVEDRYYNSEYTINFELMPLTTILYLDKVSEEMGYGYYGSVLERDLFDLREFNSAVEQGSIDCSYVYSNFEISPVCGMLEDGSIKHMYNSNDRAALGAYEEILELILVQNVEESFVYSDPANVYKINLHFEAESRKIDNYIPTKDEMSIDVKYSSDFYETVIVEESPYVDNSLYFHEEFFITLSKETLEKIENILGEFSLSRATVTPR